MNYAKYLIGKKSITLADRKFIEKHIVSIDETKTIVCNPLSEWEGETSPLVVALVQRIQDLINSDFAYWARDKWIISKGGAVQDFDRARLIILKLDSNIYSNVID